MTGKVYLIGAGPGDPELMTVKGLKLLQQADVVVYDRLANEQLLEEVRVDAIRVYVGKGPKCHAKTQDEINETLVYYGKQGRNVVRLKGGDPFVFGRGAEEALYCREHGVAFEVVPGVTAAIGAGAYAGIPVTHRTMAASFACVTAHLCDDRSDEPMWRALATGIDTVAIYMGVARAACVQKRLVDYGRSGTTPVAVIEWGTYASKQRVVYATLDTLVEQMSVHDVKNPAIIVVGDVVSLGPSLAWFPQEQPVADTPMVAIK
ncbi:MAG: uroporphyrinogen-III C-methyltransferase [Bacilli bacterium]